MSITAETLASQFPDLLKWQQGDKSSSVTRCSAPGEGDESSIIFAADPKFWPRLNERPMGILVAPERLYSEKGFASSVSQAGACFSSPNVMLAMALVNQAHFASDLNRRPFGEEPIHPSAVIAPTARLGKNVIVGPLAVIGPDVIIDDGVIIGSQSTIEAKVEIGAGTHIHPQVFVGHSSIIGKNCEIHPQTSIGTEGYGYAHDQRGNHYRLPHFGRVVLGDDVHIGACFTIDRGTFNDTVVGNGTKIDNHGHLGHNVRIGQNCLLTGGFMAAGSATMGNNCVMGGRTTFAGHITVTDNVQVAGLSGIQTDVDTPGKYGGYPLMPLSQALKATASFPHLPNLRKNVAKIMKMLNISHEDS